MRKMIHYFNFLIVIILCVVFTLCRTVNNADSTGKSISVRIEEKKEASKLPVTVEGIPILAWWGVQEHTVARYLEFKECGIDLNFTDFSNVELLAQAMDAAKEAGVKMIIHSWDLHNEPEILVNRFKDHPALAGYLFQDEPNREDFSRFSEIGRRIEVVDNKHFFYTSLFPNYASSEQLKASNYREYIQLFLQEVPTQFLSFDHYPIRINNSGIRSLNSGWYENLEIISDEARKADIPFWAFALTTAHGPYPLPTLSDIRLQVYSNLAYGAQGIQYFTYWTPSPNLSEGFNNGPIDYDTQQKTPTWYIVQQMNREIKALSNVFFGAQVIKVEHIAINSSGGDGNIPTGTKRFIFANRPTEAKKNIKKFTIPNNTNAVVSFLKNGKKCYIVIVNCKLDDRENTTFTIEGSGLQLIKKDGKAVNTFSQSSKQTVTPGDVLIYGWDIK
jgi:hypothetical protein